MPYVLAVSTGDDEVLDDSGALRDWFLRWLGLVFQATADIDSDLSRAFPVGVLPQLAPPDQHGTIVGVLTGIVYVGCVWAFTPYFSVIVPLLRDTYWAFGERNWSGMLHDARLLTAVLLIAIIGWLSLRTRMRAPMFSGALLACSTGASVVYYFQHTGWYYQSFPAKALLFMAIVTGALDTIAARYGKNFGYVWPGKVAWVCAVAVSVTAFTGTAIRQRAETRKHQDQIYTELVSYPRGTTVYIFSMKMTHFPLVLDRQLVWGSRFEDLWMLPAIIQNETSRIDKNRPFKALSSERTKELAAIQRSNTAEDLQFWRPKYVFVERCAGDSPCKSLTIRLTLSLGFRKAPRSRRSGRSIGLRKPWITLTCTGATNTPRASQRRLCTPVVGISSDFCFP